jgi:hypothetical protein
MKDSTIYIRQKYIEEYLRCSTNVSDSLLKTRVCEEGSVTASICQPSALRSSPSRASNSEYRFHTVQLMFSSPWIDVGNRSLHDISYSTKGLSSELLMRERRTAEANAGLLASFAAFIIALPMPKLRLEKIYYTF